ncbi:MAG: hypothetical protein LBO08_02340 [Rickettsiales bacterium]|jgi:hypothetical protein|nr:hypothetical protein [Rickettsiales bacterium]
MKKLNKTNTPNQTQSILSWLCSPVRPINWKKYLGGAAIFSVAVLAAVSIVSAIGMKLQIMIQGGIAAGGVPSFWARLNFMAASLIDNPVSLLGLLAGFMIFGLFLFMPRAALDKRGFLSVHVASYVVMALSAMLVKFNFIFTAIMIIAALALAISAARFASGQKISNAVVLLSFPFGWTTYYLGGYFLPDSGAQTVKSKLPLYNKIIDWLNANRYGFWALWLIQIASLFIMPYPWAIFLTGVFGGFMLVAGRARTAAGFRILGWISIAVNIAVIIGVVMMAEFWTTSLLQLLLG